jgi:hypothetical protein
MRSRVVTNGLIKHIVGKFGESDASINPERSSRKLE